MAMSKRMLSPDEETQEQQQEQESHGLSLEDAIQEFVRIQTRYSELAEEKRRVMEVLVPAAFEVRGTVNTTRLTSSDGKTQLKVEFKSAFKCETDRLNTARELLGDDVFESMFKTEYKPKMRGLKPFLASRSTDERIETAKTIIREAITENDLSPQITIEKGKPELEIPW